MRKRGFVAVGAVLAMVVAGTVAAPDAGALSPPSVSKVAPTTGRTAGGTRVTITGKNFSHVSAVKFGTAKGTSLHVSSTTSLAITSPAHAAGAVNVFVVTSAGTSTAVTADHFTYVAPPAITKVSPTSGKTAAGTVVTITGKNFRQVKSVAFGSAAGTSISVPSSTTIHVTAPAHTAQLVNVRVTTAYGTSAAVTADHYTFVAPPTITSIAPTSGPIAGGTPVNVTGTNFSKVTAVKFGATAGTGLVVHSATSLTVNAPAHIAQLINIRVTTAYGTSAVVVADQFTYSGDTTAPAPVTGVSATPAINSVTLQWTNPADADFTGVVIRRATGAAPPASPTAGTLVHDVLKPLTQFVDSTGILPGTQYSYALFAHDGVPNYATSATTTTTTLTDTTAPGPVTLPTAAATGTTTVHLAWTNPGDADFTGVLIRRAVGSVAPATPTAGVPVTDALKPATSFNDSGLTTGTQYSYAFFAHDAIPNFAAAATASATTTSLSTGISGKVVAKTGGANLVGVQVVAFDPSGNSVLTTATAADGTFTLAPLAADATGYSVCFDGANATGGPSTTGYLSRCYGGQQWSGGASPPFETTPVPVTSGQIFAIATVALPTGSRISGTVTATTGGAGLANVGVLVYNVATGSAATGFGVTATAADGTYTLRGVVPSAKGYRVCFDATGATGGTSPAGYLSACHGGAASSIGLDQSAAPVPVPPGTAVTGINSTLLSGAGISGKLTAVSGGAALAGVRVLVYAVATGSAASDYGSAVTAGDGTYTIKGLTASTTGYNVCFDGSSATGGPSTTGYLGQCNSNVAWDLSHDPATAAIITATSGVVTPNINGALSAAGAISGTVTATVGGAGITGVQVEVFGSDGTFVTSAATGASGAYGVKGLAAGSYRVCFDTRSTAGNFLPECYNNIAWDGSDSPPAATTVVNVTAGTTTSGINASLAAAATISGTVTASSGGAALGNVEITVYDGSGSQTAFATTAANGTYAVTGLAADTYRVCFGGTDATGGSSSVGYQDACYSGKSWDGGFDPAPDATAVPVASGATVANINEALLSAGGIKGTVTASVGGQGLGNVAVFIDSAANNEFVEALTAADGSYHVTGLPPGTAYKVCFLAPASVGGSAPTGYLSQCYNNVAWDGGDDSVGTNAVVTAGASTTINAALLTGGSISGTVTAASGGGALANVAVLLYRVGDGQLSTSYSTSTDVNGTYTVPALPTGSYNVCFAPDDVSGGSSTTGYQAQCNVNVPWVAGDNPPVAAAAVPVTATSATTGINGSLLAASAIAGTVTAATGGAPVPGVFVEVLDSNGDFVDSGVTQPNGTYKITGLAPYAAGYTVCFSPDFPASGSTGVLPQCYLNAAWDGQTVPPRGTPVVTTAGTTATANVALVSGGGIKGKVTAATGGAGIGNVQVTVWDSTGQFVEDGATIDGGPAGGEYALGALPASATGYSVCFGANGATGPAIAGYLSECYNNVPYIDSDPLPAGTTKVPVTAATFATVSPTLVSAGGISGTVTDASGPVRDVEVEAFNNQGAFLGDANTNTNGAYQVSNLAAGTYYVCFDPSFATGSSTTGYLPQCYNGKAGDGSFDPLHLPDPVTVTLGSVHAAINAVLAPAGAISGTVTDSTGPVTDANVLVFPADLSNVISVDTRSDGSYRVSGLKAGNYFVCVDPRFASGSASTGYIPQCYNNQPWNLDFGSVAAPPDTAVTVTAGSVHSGVNAVLAPAGAIAGTVTDGSGPVAAVNVQVYTSAGDNAASTSTSDDGKYTVVGLPAGSYFVCFDASGAIGSSTTGYFDQCYNNQSWDGFTAPTNPPDTLVAVTTGNTHTGVNATLATAGAISGTVTDGTNGLNNVSVTAFDSTGSFVTNTSTAANGTYLLAGLGTASYFVCFDGSTSDSNATGYLDKCYNNQAWDGFTTPSNPPDTLVAVTAGNTHTAVNATLSAAGAISGTVTDGTNPLGNVDIDVFTTAGDFVRSASTDEGDGTYQVNGLAAGNYLVCFDASFANGSATGYLDECYNNQPWTGSSPPSNPPDALVAVTAGSTHTAVSAALSPAGAIAGTVTDGTNPVGDVNVIVYTSAGDIVQSTSTDESDGTYQVNGLAAGSYFVCFDASFVGFSSECWNAQPWDGSSTPTAPDTLVTVSAGTVHNGISATLLPSP